MAAINNNFLKILNYTGVLIQYSPISLPLCSVKHNE